MDINKKRDFPVINVNDDQDQNSPFPHPKRSCQTFHISFEQEDLVDFEAFLRKLVREELHSKIQLHYQSIQSSSSNRLDLKLHNDEGSIETSENQLKLCFLNQMESTIFTNSNIEAKDGEVLQVALCDVLNPNHSIVKTGHLSSAMIEIVVLNGDSDRNRPEEGIFDKSVLHQREGKRPLIVGRDVTLALKNGVGFIKNLSFTDNSRCTRSGKFRLGVRIKDSKISTISEPFKVMDHRGEVSKKHHPPKMGDEVWRLEGIGKGGKYHTRLSSKKITTVDQFLHAYQTNPSSLRQVLGNKVPNKLWKAMVEHASECVMDYNTNGYNYMLENDDMKDEAYKENQHFDPLMWSDPSPSAQLQHLDTLFQGDPPLIQEASTSYHHIHNYNHGGMGNPSTSSLTISKNINPSYEADDLTNDFLI